MLFSNWGIIKMRLEFTKSYKMRKKMKQKEGKKENNIR